MKKLFLFLLVVLLLAFTGCQETSPGIDKNRTDSSKENTNERLPNESINVRSIEELDYMRSMVSCTDQEMLTNYLMSVEGGGAHSKEDIEKFITIVDSIPMIELIDGDISWISYSKGRSSDTTNPYEVLYITTNSNGGDWVRLEYILSISDTSKEAILQSGKIAANSIVSKPISSEDERITLYSEIREQHVSGVGDMIKWIATIDGIYTNIVYYSTNENSVDASKIVAEVQISTLSKTQ